MFHFKSISASHRVIPQFLTPVRIGWRLEKKILKDVSPAHVFRRSWRLERLAPFGGKARSIGLSPKAKTGIASKQKLFLHNTVCEGTHPMGSRVAMAGDPGSALKRLDWLTGGTRHPCQTGDHKPTEPGIILSRTRPVGDLAAHVCKPVCLVHLQIILKQISRVFSFVPEINPPLIERKAT
jgi:hypothetical protein